MDDLPRADPRRYDDDFRPFFQRVIGLIALLATVILLLQGRESGQVMLPGLTLCYLAFAWVLLRRDLRMGIATLAIGVWLIACAAVLLFAGVHSASMVSFAFVTVLVGLTLGERWLLRLTLPSIVLILIVGAAEWLGYFVPTPRTSPLVPMLLTASTLGLTAYMVDRANRALRERGQRAEEISEQLAQHNIELAMREAEVRELNDTLEQRVGERTAELAAAMESLHRTQEDLLQNQAKATLGAMVASVTHELNTPIGNSVMAASALADQAGQFLRGVEAGQLKRSELVAFVAALRDGTDLIQRNLQRADGLLKNFKQVAADQASEQRRTFDLASCVAEVMASTQPQRKRSPHRVETSIPDGITLDSYPGPFGQVLINLINNAYLHAFDGIAEGTLRITAERRNDDVVIEIADNGIGMDHETLTRLFQPFFSTKIGHGGTGLGMTIVEGIVRKTLGGSLRVDSAPGRGSRFTITLPLSAPEAA